MASIMGSITNPELVAELPMTPCTNRGMNRMDPNIPTPVRKVVIAITVNIRFLNIERGRMGEGVRCSMKSQTANMIPEKTNSSTTCVEAQE